MTKTLLDGVNDVLDRVGILDANGPLASLTNQGKQLFIDLAVQIWNETVDEVNNMMGPQHPVEANVSTFTLATDTRAYFLPSDLVQIRWPLVNFSNGYTIEEYPHGYEQMRLDERGTTPEGVPFAAFIAEDTIGAPYLYIDKAPTAAEDGLVYEILYDRDLVMVEYDDTFPFSDAAYRAMLPVVTEGWERRKRNDFDLEEYRKHLARAMAFVNKVNRRTHW